MTLNETEEPSTQALAARAKALRDQIAAIRATYFSIRRDMARQQLEEIEGIVSAAPVPQILTTGFEGLQAALGTVKTTPGITPVPTPIPGPVSPATVTLTFRAPGGLDKTWTAYASNVADSTVMMTDRLGVKGFVTPGVAKEISDYITVLPAAAAVAPGVPAAPVAPSGPSVIAEGSAEALSAEAKGKVTAAAEGGSVAAAAASFPGVAGTRALVQQYGGSWSYIPGVGYYQATEQCMETSESTAGQG